MRTYIAHPAEEPLRLGALATVLEGARLLALRSWHPDRYDIYHCAQRAWRAQNTPVPYAAITYQLRRLVPNGNLLAYNDTACSSREEMAGLYATARDNVLRQYHRPQPPPPTAAAHGLAATA